ncbi:hypothetical protein UXO11_22520 [Enterobacter wuhouensis]|uniref:hypothetical protein n=1 Tax=Enterobacter wuhouensis TaxID=2529381 RepID=UPI002FD42540
MPHYIPNAPHGVTCIRLENGEEALYLNGELISTCSASEMYPRIVASGINLSSALSLPFKQLNCPVPDVPEWTWEDVTTSLGWAGLGWAGVCVLSYITKFCVQFWNVV